MHQLSVIIVNYNVKYFLEQALLSVQKASVGLDIEVWVVDNSSVDGSVEMVKAKFPSVNVIANEGNVGFSTANNQAIKASNSKYVLLLNPDTVVLCFRNPANLVNTICVIWMNLKITKLKY